MSAALIGLVVSSVGLLAALVFARKNALKVSLLEQALRDARAEHEQKERLLQTVVENAPMAIVVYGQTGKLLYSNAEARELFFEGQSLTGENFLRLLDRAPETLRQALVVESDALFTVEEDGQAGTYHLAKRYFDLEHQPYTLLMVKHLTPELGRQEIEVWKKVIRIINHELNNSLAPISSMVHSARLIAKNPEKLDKLERVFETIEERTSHLAAFLEGYARFARLPKPRAVRVPWAPFLDGIRMLYPDLTVSEAPSQDGYFDAGQIQQAVINLLKNAFEASSERAGVELSVSATEGGAATLTVSDRGTGMTDEVLKNALLPFFSTKEKGTGLGLALCREIVEAHRGKLRVARREGGGIEVSIWLPSRSASLPSRTGRLTLTRG
ncbi:MAG TPA: ATP-binding protein [Polyangiaceae bacterium]|nr:ATP-binding protein [Polyangiaceae bacterium]